MGTISRQRVVEAAPAAVWDLLTDAHALPRWWPRLSRVESVTETGFTEVMYSRRGRPVRLDHNYVEVEGETLLAWELIVPGSPFDRMLTEWYTRIELAPESAGTRISILERQSFRGSFRTGTFMQRRAARQRLEEALDGLEDLFDGDGGAGDG